jgi:hypothetical protein
MGKARSNPKRQAIADKTAHKTNAGTGIATRARTTTTTATGVAIVAGAGTAEGTRIATGVGNAVASTTGKATKLSTTEQQLLESKTQPKPTRKGKQMSRVRPLVCKLYPPNGIPPDHVKTWQVMRAVRKVYPDASRDVIARAIGRRKD